jgi:uncharacterized membrane protein YkgB
MHHRRIASFLIGAWIAASLLMAYVATQNFHNVDRILAAPSAGASKMLESLGHDQARMLLRYQAAEENRAYFSDWEFVQIILGVALTAMLLLATHVNRLMVLICGLMVLLVGFMHFALTPEITFTGRAFDFVPPGAGGRGHFWVLHGLYSGLELLKLLMAFAVAGYLFIFKTKVRRPEPVQLDDLGKLKRTAS